MQISFILLTFVLKNCRLFIACKIGKQCKPVQVHPFSRFSLWVNLRKLLVGEASPIPFERYLRYRLLVHSERFCRYYFWTNCPEVKTVFRKSSDAISTETKNISLTQFCILVFSTTIQQNRHRKQNICSNSILQLCGITRFKVLHIFVRINSSSRWLLHRTIRKVHVLLYLFLDALCDSFFIFLPPNLGGSQQTTHEGGNK